jgi:hypothetical protein
VIADSSRNLFRSIRMTHKRTIKGSQTYNTDKNH